MGNSSYFRFDDDKVYITASMVMGECALLLIAGLRISALSQPPTDTTLKSVIILPPHGPTPTPPPPPSVLIHLPFPLLPYDLNSPHPFPPSSRHVPSGTLQSATHSASPPSPSPTLALSLTVTLSPPLRSVAHHPDQYRPDTLGPFSRVRSPCPHLPPYPPLPNTDHPTYTGPLLV